MDTSNRVFIDLEEIAVKELGARFEEDRFGDRPPRQQIRWENKHLLPLLDIVKARVQPGKIITFLGHTPSWMFAALNCAVRPNLASLRILPPMDIWSDMPTPPIGKLNKDGHLSFKITEKNDKIYMLFKVENDSGVYEQYDPAWLYSLVLPEIPRHKHLFLRGDAPNPVPASITRGYAGYCKSVSLKYHAENCYTCAVSNSAEKRAGDTEPYLEANEG